MQISIGLNQHIGGVDIPMAQDKSMRAVLQETTQLIGSLDQALDQRLPAFPEVQQLPGMRTLHLP